MLLRQCQSFTISFNIAGVVRVGWAPTFINGIADGIVSEPLASSWGTELPGTSGSPGLQMSIVRYASREASWILEAGLDLRPLSMSGRPRLHRPLAVGASSGALGARLPARVEPWATSELAGLPVALAICRRLKLLKALAASSLGSVASGMSGLPGLPTSLAFRASSEDEVGQRLRAALYLHARSACMPMLRSLTESFRCSKTRGCSRACQNSVDWW